MQRILSVETSRSFNNQTNSEFVTKRFCCSFLLTVAFFAVLSGFLLGKFVSDKSLNEMHREMQDLSRKVEFLNLNLQKTFQTFKSNSTAIQENPFLNCNFTNIGNNQTGMLLANVYLNDLNTCFNYG